MQSPPTFYMTFADKLVAVLFLIRDGINMYPILLLALESKLRTGYDTRCDKF
jgi:hypothetical protein